MSRSSASIPPIWTAGNSLALKLSIAASCFSTCTPWPAYSRHGRLAWSRLSSSTTRISKSSFRKNASIEVTDELIREYYDVLGLTLKDVVRKNPDQIWPLLEKGKNHTDDLKHLADALDLQVKALRRADRMSTLIWGLLSQASRPGLKLQPPPPQWQFKLPPGKYRVNALCPCGSGKKVQEMPRQARKGLKCSGLHRMPSAWRLSMIGQIRYAAWQKFQSHATSN